jgi:arsenate reductase
MQHILFVCTNNAGRSQITEALFRQAYGDDFTVSSAGVDPWPEIHPVGRAMMNRLGYSMEGHVPKHVDTIDFNTVDIVVTLGDPAEQGTRELRQGCRHIHWPLADPARADGTARSEAVFEETHGWIEAQISKLIKQLSIRTPIRDAHWLLGTCTCVFRSQPGGFQPHQHIPLLSRHGFRSIELTCYFEGRDFDNTCQAKRDDLRRICSEHGIAINSIHPPETLDLLDDLPEKREHSLAQLAQFIDSTMDLQAVTYPIHLWSHTQSLNDIQGRIEEVTEALEHLCRTRNVQICLETLRSNVSAINNSDLLAILHDTTLALTLDTGHAQISGDLLETLDNSRHILGSLHLHENDGIDDLHRPPNGTHIPWPEFAQSLHRAEYYGPITYEVECDHGEEISTTLHSIVQHYQEHFVPLLSMPSGE